MTQIFRPSSNSFSRASLLIAGGTIVVLALAAYFVTRSPYANGVRYAEAQPVAFSHKHHVKGLGLDCRFCHATVERAASASMPSTEVCMSCHSQIFNKSPALEPVRESWQSGRPLRWNRTHDLPDYTYFNHQIHVSKGVSCLTCHGQTDEMPLTWKAHSLSMAWCLNCHFSPDSKRGDPKDVFRLDQSDPNVDARSRAFVKAHPLELARLKNCYECHR